MKISVLTGIIFLLGFSPLVFSQTKQISANEFLTINSNGHSLLSERSWRVITKTDTMNGGSIIKSITKTHEQLLPDKTRFLVVEKEGDKETRNEFVSIGSMEYRRENDGPWTSKDARGTGIGSGSGSGIISCAQYTEDADFISGISARKLRQYLIEKTPEGLSFDDYRAWFDQNGLFVRSERTKGLLEPRLEKTYSIATYEYNPNIKIDAPIK